MWWHWCFQHRIKTRTQPAAQGVVCGEAPRNLRIGRDRLFDVFARRFVQFTVGVCHQGFV
jgi:hypothetical protein